MRGPSPFPAPRRARAEGTPACRLLLLRVSRCAGRCFSLPPARFQPLAGRGPGVLRRAGSPPGAGAGGGAPRGVWGSRHTCAGWVGGKAACALWRELALRGGELSHPRRVGGHEGSPRVVEGARFCGGGAAVFTQRGWVGKGLRVVGVARSVGAGLPHSRRAGGWERACGPWRWACPGALTARSAAGGVGRSRHTRAGWVGMKAARALWRGLALWGRGCRIHVGRVGGKEPAVRGGGLARGRSRRAAPRGGCGGGAPHLGRAGGWERGPRLAEGARPGARARNPAGGATRRGRSRTPPPSHAASTSGTPHACPSPPRPGSC